ncbi:MAG: UDP-N-acetylglucosamine--N-acetylmuramyl-(pentapeptide) pyrophosphoryl-undecaprenol N-acetylglucosamine transferase [Patescibacteria group bacterium]
MKILMTGGHLTPALAVIDGLMVPEYKDKTTLVFVGRKYSLDSESAFSLEYKEVVKRNIPFISLTTGRINRSLSFGSIKNILKVPFGFLHALSILRNERPDAILSFGGYIAVPVAVAGWLIGIAVYTHEQTIKPGLANRLIALFCKTVFYSFPEVRKYFSGKRAIMSGNPIRSSVMQIQKKPFEIKKTKPVIYITGGSLGSHAINNHIMQIVGELLDDFIVIHQTGNVKQYHDYERLMRQRRKLPSDKRENYYICQHFYNDQIGYVYEMADLVIGRAGANTFFELIHLKKPAIFIPLPWSANKEQQYHADFFQNYRIGEIFEQKKNSKALLELIRRVSSNLQTYRRNFKSLPLQIRQNAAEIIIREIHNKK